MLTLYRSTLQCSVLTAAGATPGVSHRAFAGTSIAGEAREGNRRMSCFVGVFEEYSVHEMKSVRLKDDARRSSRFLNKHRAMKAYGGMEVGL